MDSTGSDITKKVHSDALAFTSGHKHHHDHVPPGNLDSHVYKLLIKNVSRNDPLSEDEVKVLKDFRAKLTNDQWQAWLNFARHEKHLLKRMKAHRDTKSPTKTGRNELDGNPHDHGKDIASPVIKVEPDAVDASAPVPSALLQDPEQLLRILQAIQPVSNNESQSAEEVPIRAPDYPHSAISAAGDSSQKSYSSKEVSSVPYRPDSSPAVAEAVRKPTPPAAGSPSPPRLHTAVTHHNRYKAAAPQSNQSMPPGTNTLSRPKAMSVSDSGAEDGGEEEEEDVSVSTTSGGVSLGRVAVMGRGERLRPASAPPRPPQQASQQAHGHVAPAAGVRAGASSNSAVVQTPAASTRSRGSPFSTISTKGGGPVARTTSYPPSPKLPADSRSNSLFSSDKQGRLATAGPGRPRSASVLGTGAGTASSGGAGTTSSIHAFGQQPPHHRNQQRAARAPVSPYVSLPRSEVGGGSTRSPTAHQHAHPHTRVANGSNYSGSGGSSSSSSSSSSNTAALDLARSTAFRIDSAYSAAQYLMSSFAPAGGTVAGDGVRGSEFDDGATHGGDAEEKQHAAISILSEMMRSMEKSKEALAKLAKIEESTGNTGSSTNTGGTTSVPSLQRPGQPQPITDLQPKQQQRKNHFWVPSGPALPVSSSLYDDADSEQKDSRDDEEGYRNHDEFGWAGQDIPPPPPSVGMANDAYSEGSRDSAHDGREQEGGGDYNDAFDDEYYSAIRPNSSRSPYGYHQIPPGASNQQTLNFDDLVAHQTTATRPADTRDSHKQTGGRRERVGGGGGHSDEYFLASSSGQARWVATPSRSQTKPPAAALSPRDPLDFIDPRQPHHHSVRTGTTTSSSDWAMNSRGSNNSASVKRGRSQSVPRRVSSSMEAPFKPWEKQLRSAAAAPYNSNNNNGNADDDNGGGGESQVDAVAMLQTQLHDQQQLASTRRATNALQLNYQYSNAGYVWDGVRYEKGQGMVARLCIAQGHIMKTMDGYPIRVDAESSVVDVVWREQRHGAGNPLPVENVTMADLSYSTLYEKARQMNQQQPPDAREVYTSAPMTPLSSSSNGGDGGNSSTSRNRNSVLRRERFGFDDVFLGPTALGRLSMYTRQRTRKALESAHNLVFMCLGCGDVTNEQSMEPPLSLLLGGGGGTGLISSAIDEIFRYTKPLSMQAAAQGSLYGGGLPSCSPSSFLAAKVAYEQMTARITLSAVIFTEDGQIYDLLNAGGGGPALAASASMANLKRRKSDGRVMLCNAARVYLETPADFDRVTGLLLGKRSAMTNVLQSMEQRVGGGGGTSSNFNSKTTSGLQHTSSRGASSTSNRYGYQSVSHAAPDDPAGVRSMLAGMDPWVALRTAAGGGGAGEPVESSSVAASMLLTISVCGGGVSRSQTSVDFNFVSPCGKYWSNPGPDINIVAEIISSLPHVPPPSLLRASPLGMLLMDPRSPATDFVNLVTVHRDESALSVNKKARNHPKTVHQRKSAQSEQIAKRNDESLVRGALHSMRIIAQLA